ncbi:hypothetical protein KUTeg_012651 [Tegillarca granosa]|uniref:Uncharacterized protein n=1 Tax=Tegillarca granosa TaxID=220873 RepID=A0ABQ9F2L7_TEGGR|nr:hypothetical protein KUTeg_012651 [Tegillarca granosa]
MKIIIRYLIIFMYIYMMLLIDTLYIFDQVSAEVYLLDDPLSAVDIHIGRHIFSNCIMKLLKGKKTVLFVTHQLQYLSHCDGIIVMADGSITERGKHEDLMAKKGEYSNLITTFYTKEHKDEFTLLCMKILTNTLKNQYNDDRKTIYKLGNLV